jgi:hypothetical protein
VGTFSFPGGSHARLGNGAYGCDKFSGLPEQAWSDDEGDFSHLFQQRDVANRNALARHVIWPSVCGR